jgi:curli biogenesis system outer membrane secretion channel CsgG
MSVKKFTAILSALSLLGSTAYAQTNMSSQDKKYKDGTTKGASSGRRAQEKAATEIPRCTKRLGTVAIVEPDNQWWRELNLGSPEAILKVFVQQSGCFGLVNRGRSMQSRNLERAMADSGELQAGSNLGKGQVKAADYFLQPDIVSSNRNSGGGGIGGALGGMLGGTFGAIAGGLNIKKKEANVTLSIVNARTTEEEALTEGYARKTDVGFGGGGGAGWWGGFAAAGGGGYQNTEIGQVIVLAYLDAYTKLVTQLGGLPENAAAAAPQAH